MRRLALAILAAVGGWMQSQRVDERTEAWVVYQGRKALSRLLALTGGCELGRSDQATEGACQCMMSWHWAVILVFQVFAAKSIPNCDCDGKGASTRGAR